MTPRDIEVEKWKSHAGKSSSDVELFIFCNEKVVPFFSKLFIDERFLLKDASIVSERSRSFCWSRHEHRGGRKSWRAVRRNGEKKGIVPMNFSRVSKQTQKKEKKKKSAIRLLSFSFFPKIGCSICHSSYLITWSSLSRLVLQFKYFSSKLKPLWVIYESPMMSRGCRALRATRYEFCTSF